LGFSSLPANTPFLGEGDVDRLVASETGGAQQHINKNNVNELPIVCPSERVMRSFVETVRPVFDRIRDSCFESRTLVDLRDSLLPKLISGELRITNVEPILAGGNA
jgi:type I restriction enzyme S subunit